MLKGLVIAGLLLFIAAALPVYGHEELPPTYSSRCAEHIKSLPDVELIKKQIQIEQMLHNRTFEVAEGDPSATIKIPALENASAPWSAGTVRYVVETQDSVSRGRFVLGARNVSHFDFEHDYGVEYAALAQVLEVLASTTPSHTQFILYFSDEDFVEALSNVHARVLANAPFSPTSRLKIALKMAADVKESDHPVIAAGLRAGLIPVAITSVLAHPFVPRANNMFPNYNVIFSNAHDRQAANLNVEALENKNLWKALGLESRTKRDRYMHSILFPQLNTVPEIFEAAKRRVRQLPKTLDFRSITEPTNYENMLRPKGTSEKDLATNSDELELAEAYARSIIPLNEVLVFAPTLGIFSIPAFDGVVLNRDTYEPVANISFKIRLSAAQGLQQSVERFSHLLGFSEISDKISSDPRSRFETYIEMFRFLGGSHDSLAVGRPWRLVVGGLPLGLHIEGALSRIANSRSIQPSSRHLEQVDFVDYQGFAFSVRRSD